MRDVAIELFDDFARRFARGERPDLREYLSRAGEQSDELSQLLDTFLAGSEPPPADPERVRLLAAWATNEPPLLELRKSRRLKRDELVSRLTALLGLKPDRQQKVGRYYHELEAGLLRTRGVDQRVWDALETLFGTDVRSLARWRPPPAAAPKPAAMYRRLEAAAPTAAASIARSRSEEEDEVDRLFRSAR